MSTHLVANKASLIKVVNKHIFDLHFSSLNLCSVVLFQILKTLSLPVISVIFLVTFFLVIEMTKEKQYADFVSQIAHIPW